MKKIVSLLLIFSLCSALLSMLTACANKNPAVPDDFAIRTVGECKYAYYNSTTTVTHNKYDPESYLDYVTIMSKSENNYGFFVSTYEAVFQYNRTSDLWTPLDVEEWTEPRYTFNNRLVSSYDIGAKDEEYDITGRVEILSVTEKEIQLTYDISAELYVAFSLTDYLHIEESGITTLKNGDFGTLSGTPYMSIDIKLPEGWCDRYGDDYVSLIIKVDLKTGIDSVYILGDVIPDNSN